MLGRLREAVKAGKVCAVYVYSPDRLSRNLRHLTLLGEEFASAGAELRFVKCSVGKAGSHGRMPYRCDRHTPVEPTEEHAAKGRMFNPIKLMFELARAGLSLGRIAAGLKEMGI